EYAARLGGLEAIMPFRSASFELDVAIAARILSLNPAIYEEIQFGNTHAAEVLDRLLERLAELRDLVRRGDDEARARFRERFLRSREGFGARALAEGNYAYERVGYLLADLVGSRYTSVHLPDDRPGSLCTLLHVFERHGVSLESIHSSRTPGGEVHFRIGFVRGTDRPAWPPRWRRSGAAGSAACSRAAEASRRAGEPVPDPGWGIMSLPCRGSPWPPSPPLPPARRARRWRRPRPRAACPVRGTCRPGARVAAPAPPARVAHEPADG